MNTSDISTVDGFDLSDHPDHQIGSATGRKQPSHYHPFFGTKPSTMSVKDWEKAIELYNKLSEV